MALNKIIFGEEALGKSNEFVSQGNLLGIESALMTIDEAFLGVEAGSRHTPYSQLYNRIIALEHQLILAIQVAKNFNFPDTLIRKCIPNVLRIHRKSSFIRHIQDWPLGYPGDYLAINMIVDRHEEASRNSPEGIMGRYALSSAIAQQHREKLEFQANMIKVVCREFQAPTIVSIACGPSRDIEKAQCEIKESGAKVVLIDFDQRAIIESLYRLEGILEQVDTIIADVRKVGKLFKDLSEVCGKMHLVYAGGLFDYLPDSIIKSLLRRFSREHFQEKGKLIFTNIAEGNPYREWITLGNWNLIERDQAQMEDMLSWVSLRKKSLELDPTGLTWIAVNSNE